MADLAARGDLEARGNALQKGLDERRTNSGKGGYVKPTRKSMPGKGGKTTPGKSEKSKEPTQPPVQEDTAEDEERTIWIQNFLKNVGIIPGSSITDEIHNTLEVVLVDPAGLKFVTKVCPKNAGGASGAIYKWLGINKSKQFCKEVDDALQKIEDAVGIADGSRQTKGGHPRDRARLPRQRDLGGPSSIRAAQSLPERVGPVCKVTTKVLDVGSDLRGHPGGQVEVQDGRHHVASPGRSIRRVRRNRAAKNVADKHHGAHVHTAWTGRFHTSVE